MADEVTLIKALNQNLRLPGESLTDFAKQVKALSPADKDDYARLFAEMGIDVKVDWR